MHLWTSTSMQMIDHKVGKLVSAINKPKNQWENKGKVEEMRCSCRQDERHEKKQQNRIFANCSQTVRNHCEFRNVLATSFALRNSIAPVHCTFAKFASHKTLAKFRIAKFAMCWQPVRNLSSHCEIRKPYALFICLT